MQTSKVKNLLLAAACNAEYESFDWQGGLVAFGASSLVHVYHVGAIKTLAALCGHSGRVNNAKFLKTGEIVSVCSEGKVLVFKNPHYIPGKEEEFFKNEDAWTKWNIAAQFELKGKNFVQFSLLELDGHTVGAFLTTESDLHLLRIDLTGGLIIALDRLIFGNNLLEASSLFKYKSTYYMCVSCSDFMVHIYRLASLDKVNAALDGSSLQFLNSLKGHEDKVKCLSSVVCNSGKEEIALIASGSKDNFIRVWRITETLTDKIQQEFIKKNIYKIGEHYLHLESNLHGHGDAVSSVQWAYTGADKEGQEDGLLLLSSSFDFSLQVWQREAQSKVGWTQ
jgi:WD40 repeat protein